MKTLPFNLEKAKAGHPLVTRDGRDVKFLAYVLEVSGLYPVVCFIDGDSYVNTFAENGRAAMYETQSDLFLKVVPKKRLMRPEEFPPAWWIKREGDYDMVRHGDYDMVRHVTKDWFHYGDYKNWNSITEKDKWYEHPFGEPRSFFVEEQS
jgi:hypothetical protein